VNENCFLPNRTINYIDVENRYSIVTNQIGGSIVGITRLQYDGQNFGRVASPDLEDAILVHVHRRPQIVEISIDGRPFAPLNRPAGHTSILDFRQRLEARLLKPFDMFCFHLPFSVFDDIAPRYGGRSLTGVRATPFDHFDDPVVRGLGAALSPTIHRPNEVNTLFLDHVGWALIAHVGERYGQLELNTRRHRGRLAAWQERRAKEIIDANMSGNVTLANLAAACRLSVGHFSTAFRKTCGMPPHQWLLFRRIERAKSYLISTELPLATIASACGFFDQSHLQRVFTRFTGVTPGTWRKRNAHGDVVDVPSDESSCSGARSMPSGIIRTPTQPGLIGCASGPPSHARCR
jgi:AraC family transcriptional regulator